MTNTAAHPDQLANLALVLLRERQARARKAVAAGTMDRASAEAHLRPWLAVAIRAGAACAEIADLLANNAAPGWSEPQVRAMAAHDLCPTPTWHAPLASARDRAIERADSGAAEDILRGRGLVALCRRLGVILPYLPVPKRKSA